jgi:hypothetical protein
MLVASRGRLAAALASSAADLLAQPPSIEPIDIVATKLPQ